jgi:hypothetical protein
MDRLAPSKFNGHDGLHHWQPDIACLKVPFWRELYSWVGPGSKWPPSNLPQSSAAPGDVNMVEGATLQKWFLRTNDEFSLIMTTLTSSIHEEPPESIYSVAVVQSIQASTNNLIMVPRKGVQEACGLLCRFILRETSPYEHTQEYLKVLEKRRGAVSIQAGAESFKQFTMRGSVLPMMHSHESRDRLLGPADHRYL